MEKFFQIFQDLHCDISFVDALLLMLKFASTIKSLLKNKDKLFELAKIPLNENCSAMLLKKLLEKLGDPGKFLIYCDFSRMDVCHALADLDASINLMPLSIWQNLSLPELTPTRILLIVDFEADPRVPLILGRSFLRTGRALIDIYGEEITLRVNDEAITFNLNQTMRYSSTYDDLSVNRIDIIDVAREKYAQEILGFSSNYSGDNPISTFEPILSNSSLSLTPFEGSDFILEEINAYLKDESVLLEIDHADCDPEGDICLIENLLNNDPFQLPFMDLKQGEVVKAKSSIEEPPKLELKELPSHLEYAYLKGVDKLPVIIAKDLKVDEKEALLKVLKSHKRAIAWKITDIKGIDPRSITRPNGVAEDVFIKVGKFHFPTDFVVANFEADPRVPLILGRSFLRTGRALIDVYGEEITLQVNDEAVTFNLNQTMRYSSTYDDLSVVKQETEETTDKEQTNLQESTAHIQPPVTLISEPDVLKTLPKTNIPYPSRLNDQKLREKATNQM
nr:reverse transcriptase domain-containing protein [Tanacetum cinerariifolium]